MESSDSLPEPTAFGISSESFECSCLRSISDSSRVDFYGGACFDETRRYRYGLWRRWDPKLAPMVVVLLNPSIADEMRLDSTLTRVSQFARLFGHGGFVVANAFALVSTDPQRIHEDPLGSVGAANDDHIRAYAKLGSPVVAGWGVNLEAKELAFRVHELRMLIGDRATCLGTTKAGSPRHPLYLAASTLLRPFSFDV